MGIEELRRKLIELGVGADVKLIAEHLANLQATVNLGIVSNDEVAREMELCEEVLKGLDGRKLAKFKDYSGGGGSNWPMYVRKTDKMASQFMGIAEEMYREDGGFQLLVLKKHLGIKAMAQYRFGKLVGVFVYFAGKHGVQIKKEDEHIKGIPNTIGDVSSDIVKVYGTLTSSYSELSTDRAGLERNVAVLMVEELEKENAGKLKFIAEYVNGRGNKLSDGLGWADSCGFEVAEYSTVETDIYEIDDYMNDKGFELFEYSNEELVDTVLVMLNDTEELIRAATAYSGHFDKNVVAIRIIDTGEYEEKESPIKGVKLYRKNGNCSIVVEFEPVTTRSGFEVGEVEVSLDELYELEASEKVALEFNEKDVRIKKEER